MTRVSVLALVLAGALVVGCAQAPASPEVNSPTDLAGVDTLRAAFSTAFNAGDAEGIGALYAENAVSMTNMQPTATGRAAIIEAQRATFSQFSVNMTITPDETHTVGTTGWERGRYTMALTPKAGGDPMSLEGRYLILLEKGADGKWLAISDIDNLPTPPPAPAAAPAPAK